MLDLRDVFNEDGSEKPEHAHQDLSGRPVPKNVRVVLDSGLEVPCTVRYDGHSELDKRYRRYLLAAEVDWAKHHVIRILAEENPIDVHLIMRFPDTLDSELLAEQQRLTANVELWVLRQT